MIFRSESARNFSMHIGSFNFLHALRVFLKKRPEIEIRCFKCGLALLSFFNIFSKLMQLSNEILIKLAYFY